MKLIAAVDRNWAIGKDGDQLVYLSTDLKRFKALTMGHPIILGRKTLSTFPGGRPLKGRPNLILSRTMTECPAGGEVFTSLDALRAAAPADAVVVGGGSVYRDGLYYQDRRSFPCRHLAAQSGYGPCLDDYRRTAPLGGGGAYIPLCDLPAQRRAVNGRWQLFRARAEIDRRL